VNKHFDYSSADADRRVCVNNLFDIPAVAEYLRPYCATPRGMRKAVIREPVGKYFKDVAVITLSKDGTVDAPDGFKPTDVEAAEIKAACQGVQWPELKPVDNLRTPGKLPAEVEEADRELQVLRPGQNRNAPGP
jgi:hypothetical protein